MTNFSCLIVAGGLGTRFGGAKQSVCWRGKTLLAHVSDKCSLVTDDVIIEGYSALGRQGAVFNGLSKVVYDTVVILEAARPGVTTEQIIQIANEAFHYASVSYAIPSIDTIYDTQKQQHMLRTHSYQLQVPQAFNVTLLKEAYIKVNNYVTYTSDTALMHDVHNIKPKLLQGGFNLLKVTYKQDLKMLDLWTTKGE